MTETVLLRRQIVEKSFHCACVNPNTIASSSQGIHHHLDPRKRQCHVKPYFLDLQLPAGTRRISSARACRWRSIFWVLSSADLIFRPNRPSQPKEPISNL